MLFNLNEFLMAVSFTLDFIEMDILGVTSNHGKRTAYTSLRLGRQLGLSPKELHDLVALAIMHDNGVSEKFLHDKFLKSASVDGKGVERIKEHCIIGEENVSQYPFLTSVKDVIKYHHEKYDGTGFFQVKGEDIPLMSQIIYMADVMEVNFDLDCNDYDIKRSVSIFINSQKGKMFSPKVANAFQSASKDIEFWNNLKDNCVENALKMETPNFSMELPIEKVRKITGVFSKIIDSKSQYTQKHSSDLSKKTEIMADYYKMDSEQKTKLMIAADLHDIGKLAVPNSILDSPNKLTSEEFEIVKKHPALTRLALQEIKGFEEITDWAANHHEKLNGKGYPLGKSAKELDFNSRLLACLDIYEALTEERPYRKALMHGEAMEILQNMKDDGFIDDRIVQDIDLVFARKILY